MGTASRFCYEPKTFPVPSSPRCPRLYARLPREPAAGAELAFSAAAGAPCLGAACRVSLGSHRGHTWTHRLVRGSPCCSSSPLGWERSAAVAAPHPGRAPTAGRGAAECLAPGSLPVGWAKGVGPGLGGYAAAPRSEAPGPGGPGRCRGDGLRRQNRESQAGWSSLRLWLCRS